MLNREDVERIIANAFKELTLDSDNGDFTDPNTRIIYLKYKGEVIDSVSFNVVQVREYED